jgi:hypothetical protein
VHDLQVGAEQTGLGQVGDLAPRRPWAAGVQSARSPASACVRPRTLWHQSCTVVIPELIASAQARRVPW